MFNVLLVDDENRIINYLQNSIPWKELDLTIVGTACNGLDALNMITNQSIDIVITDIRMPDFNGLELCKQIQKMDMNIQTIIISGYADFSYAQKAMQFNVVGYCLKPIEDLELISLLKTAKKNLLNNSHLQNTNILDCIADDDFSIINSILSKNGIDTQQYYIAVSINLDDISAMISGQFSLKLSKNKYLYFSTDPFDVEVANTIILSHLNFKGIGLYPQPIVTSQLKDAISDTIVMAYQYFINGTSTVCNIKIDDALSNTTFHDLTQNSDTTDCLYAFVKKLKKSDYLNSFNIRSAFKLNNQIYFSSIFSQTKLADEAYLYEYEQLALDCSSFNTMLDEILTCISHHASTSTPNMPVVYPSTSFMKIVRHLNASYATDISLKSISTLFNMNSNYLSQLFKSETGMTYSQYITELRINKAKQLIKESRLSLSEISECVGFNDYFYFIKKFKKVVGVTPGNFS